jgi:hypothetical protein
MREDLLLSAVYQILVSGGKAGKKEVIDKLKALFPRKKLVKEAIRYLTNNEVLYYLPNICGLGYTLLLVEYNSADEKKIVENKYSIKPFIDLKPAIFSPQVYSIYSLPTLISAELLYKITNEGVNAYMQNGYYDCYSLDAKKRPLLIKFAHAIAQRPFLSIRKISEITGIRFSTGKFLYRELEKKRFFDGRFILSKSRFGNISQYLFLVKKGYEEPEYIEGVKVSYINSFSYKDASIKLGIAYALGSENFLERVAGLLCNYYINIFNLF